MQGTTIADLSRGDNDIRGLQAMTQGSYNANQNLQYEQGHNAAYSMHQAQHMPYHTMGIASPAQSYKKSQEDLDIEELARDINENLPSEMNEVNETEEHFGESSMNLFSVFPAQFRDPILIVLLFLLLSQGAVKEFIGKYIPQINADETCVVSFTGILIYGIILAGLFSLCKRFIV